METFLQICKENQGHRKQKKVRRWQVVFALNFNLLLKSYLHEQGN